MAGTAQPLKRKEEHREGAAHRYKTTAVVILRKFDIE
jgi:hypothetical protein